MCIARHGQNRCIAARTPALRGIPNGHEGFANRFDENQICSCMCGGTQSTMRWRDLAVAVEHAISTASQREKGNARIREDMIRSSAPGGNIGKPLMARALAALLASAALFRGSGAGQLARARNRPRTRVWIERVVEQTAAGGLGNVTNSWVGSEQNQPVSPGQLGSALGPNIVKTPAQQSGLSEEELSGRLPTAAELSKLM